MTVRERIIDILETNDSNTDHELAVDLDVPVASVRRTRRQLELDGIVVFAGVTNYHPKCQLWMLRSKQDELRMGAEG